MTAKTLSGFLLDVIIDEEITARRQRDTRLVAETTAKRRIINEHAGTLDGHCQCCGIAAPCPTIRYLAMPYAGRRGFREEWRAETSPNHS